MSEIDHLRDGALLKRINGIAGGLRICWSTRDVARLTDFIRSAPADMLTRDAPAVARKPAVSSIADARRKFSKSVVIRDAEPADRNFLFIVSSDTVDRSGDFIIPTGVDIADFAKNPAVLNSHNSGAMPIAVSTLPAVAGNSLTAVAKFPAPGVSCCGDEVAAALTAGLVRGASVGFIPICWAFSKDPSRPFGVDFQEIRLLEWSICAVPCNPDCLMIGAVEGGKSSRSKDAPEDESDWQCLSNGALPVDGSDDSYDAPAAKAALLAACSSSDGTILTAAADHFLAVDASSPLAAKSYQFPFSRVTDAGFVAAKTGWRQGLAAMETSAIPNLPISDARSLVDTFEDRLEDVKTAQRRREAQDIGAKARAIIASTSDAPPLTREQRMAEARNFRRALMDK